MTFKFGFKENKSYSVIKVVLWEDHKFYVLINFHVMMYKISHNLTVPFSFCKFNSFKVD